MRRALNTLLGLFLVVWMQGQVRPTCQPAANVPQSFAGGVLPLPYSPSGNPGGGIRDTACLNTYFQYTFTIKVPETVTLQGVSMPVNNVALHADSAVANLPKGMQYACNPPNCVFPKAGVGCLILYGAPENPTDAKTHTLSIRGTLNSLVPLPLSFPDSTLFAPGNYFLHVRPEGSLSCKTSNTRELAATRLQVRNIPNPFSSETEIEVNSRIRGRFDFRVYDFTGNLILRDPVQLYEGQNLIRFSADDLPNGIYIYTLTDGLNSVSRKMVLHR